MRAPERLEFGNLKLNFPFYCAPGLGGPSTFSCNSLITSTTIHHEPKSAQSLRVMVEQKSRFAWTTGGDKRLLHKRWIETGGSGAVHEVCMLP